MNNFYSFAVHFISRLLVPEVSSAAKWLQTFPKMKAKLVKELFSHTKQDFEVGGGGNTKDHKTPDNILDLA